MLRLLRESTYSAWLTPSRGIWLLALAGFFYSFFMLFLNFDRGLDITDESFYLLWASHPQDFSVQLTQFGHYTGILYWMVAGDLEWFRISGLLVLLAAAGFFAASLDGYLRLLMPLSTRPRWMSVPLVLSSTLVYYTVFPLWTPSYNWLALFSTLLVATGLLQAATNSGHSDPLAPRNLKFVRHGILVGIGGALAFAAKPTTAAVLALISVAWVLATRIRDRWMGFLSVSAIFSVLFLVIHGFVFENGPNWMFVQTTNALDLYNRTVDTSYFQALFSQVIWDFGLTESPFKTGDINIITAPWVIFRTAWVAILLLFGILIGVGISVRRQLPIKRILITGLASVGIAAWLQLWRMEFWMGGLSHGTRIGMGILSFSFVLALSAVITQMFSRTQERQTLPLGGFGTLYLFLISLPIAYAFGTSNGVTQGSSGAFVFYSTAAVLSSSWIDSCFGKRFFGQVTQLLIILSVALIVRSSLEDPYRLAGTISDQTVPVTVLGGGRPFFVDEATADYIVGLQTLALDADWERGSHLIDLTGGSPGATVVLDGRAPGVPWLSGGYEGSERSTHAALSLVSQTVLDNAWVLSAPTGKQSISATVLSDLGLDFPSSYQLLGSVTSGHREEEQILWRPRN